VEEILTAKYARAGPLAVGWSRWKLYSHHRDGERQGHSCELLVPRVGNGGHWALTAAAATEHSRDVESAELPFAALAPVVVLALAFVGYCLFDLRRSEVRYFPKWAWAIVCIVSIPLGGIVYLLAGRQRR
jgi:hypothetical protein